METVGDLDIIVASTQPEPVMDWFTSVKSVVEVTAKGRTKSSVRFDSGLQADLRIVPVDRFAFALHHFTGSKNHNVHMRQRALERGYSLSEWGLFKVEHRHGGEGDAGAASAREPDIAAGDEAALFKALGLAFIQPELREDRGEIEAADFQTGTGLPELIEASDLRGAFHNHTQASDGQDSLLAMARAAAALGWEYLGIADHSKASFQANGLDEERLLSQVEAIRALNNSGEVPVHVFAGCEVDILKDGQLDFADEVLAQLDYVVASVHSSFSQPEAEMTARLIRAIENPHVTMLGHLSGRLLLKREAYALDVAKVVDAAIANHTVIELNANPSRLDMDWRHWRAAADKGLMCAINPDAHAAAHLEFVEAGVLAARKGWLEARHVLNTRPLAEVHKWLLKRD